MKTAEELMRVFCDQLQKHPEVFSRGSLRKLTVEFVVSREQRVRAVNFTPSEHSEVQT